MFAFAQSYCLSSKFAVHRLEVEEEEKKKKERKEKNS
jgi:hypothetical protein